MLCATRNIQAGIPDQTRQNPADKGTGMPRGCDIAVVDHRMTLPADQAIRAHGGDSRASRDAYVAAAPAERSAIIAFLKSLIIEDETDVAD